MGGAECGLWWLLLVLLLDLALPLLPSVMPSSECLLLRPLVVSTPSLEFEPLELELPTNLPALLPLLLST